MTRAMWLAAWLAVLPLNAACSDPPAQEEIVFTPGNPPGAAKSRRGAEGGELGAGGAPPKMEIQEEDFAETERSRDPFRSYADLFARDSTAQAQVQRRVVLEDYSVDDLKLIGIVKRINPAKAMIVDPEGVGHVVQRGDFVGRSERVQATNADTDFELNWRIERIRDTDLVLVREDPSNPDVPSATRVLALRPEQLQ